MKRTAKLTKAEAKVLRWVSETAQSMYEDFDQYAVNALNEEQFLRVTSLQGHARAMLALKRIVDNVLSGKYTAPVEADWSDK